MSKITVTRSWIILCLLGLLLGSPANTPVAAAAGAASAAISAVGPQIDAGNGFTCAITDAGSIQCWGDNTYGQGIVPEFNEYFIQVSAGDGFTCGLRVNFGIQCWGDAASAALDVPEPVSGFTQVSAGGAHACGLRSDGSIACWGANEYSQRDVPTPNAGFTQVSAGKEHTCALKADGSLACWGRNHLLQAGVPAENSGFTQVSAGAEHTCALKVGGGMVCWGDNGAGQTVVPESSSGFLQVSAGDDFTCALKVGGALACWGLGVDGQTGVPLENSGFVRVTAGTAHACAVKTGGVVVCWGAYGDEPPAAPDANAGYIQISAGDAHSCGLKSDGSILCWGLNVNGVTDVPAPNSGFIQIDAGLFHTCGLKSDSSISCWGHKTYGETVVPEFNSGFIQVSAGAFISCGLKSDSSLVCWGYGALGQTTVPDPNSGFTQVSAGYNHSCGLKADGSILCWGLNDGGQTDVPEPNSGFTQMSIGWNYTCGLKVDGTLLCWGQNDKNQLDIPEPNSGFTQVSAGLLNNSAVDVFGWITSWGDSDPAVATGRSTIRDDIIQVVWGTVHLCLLRVNGTVMCGGVDYAGRAPHIAVTQNNIPSIYGEWLNVQLTASGGIPPDSTYTFTEVGNAKQPPGLRLASDGVISGTPTRAGSFVICFFVRDGHNYEHFSAVNLDIARANPMVTAQVANTPVVYDGAPHAAIVNLRASSIPGALTNIRYNGSAAVPTNAGTYAVTARFIPTDPTNYNSLNGLAAGSFVIEKADPGIDVEITNPSIAYDGVPHAATVELGASSTPGALTNIRYNGSTVLPTNAGTYAVTADFTPTDSVNYNSLSGLAAGSFVIEKADPSIDVEITNPSISYDGAPHAATVELSASSIPGALTNIRYNGSAAAPTNAGTYAVTADFTPTDSANYNSLSGLAAGSFTIQPAAATIALGNLTQTYTGTGRAAAVTTTPPGLNIHIMYAGSTAAPTSAGSYAVTAEITDPNYTGSSNGTLVIEKAPLTVTADSLARVYGAPNPPLTYTFSGFVNNENAGSAGIRGAPEISTAAAAGSPPGVYPITIRAGSLSAPNYTFAGFVDGSLTVSGWRIFLPAIIHMGN